NMHAGSEVDARGRFIIEGLPSGTYELTLNVRSNTPTSTLPPQQVKQTVNVTNGTETEATLTLNLTATNTEKEQ
ncbi:MAG: hypothetical protein H0T92_24355, partial [Pyrinomonadaceae bacterium]|nr:hypothetical protein [Pyrinomonadaceae bacterium]